MRRTDPGVQLVVCLECHREFVSVGRHVTAAHGISSREYRERHGIPLNQSLATQDYGALRREVALRSGGPERLRELAKTNQTVNLAAWRAAGGRHGAPAVALRAQGRSAGAARQRADLDQRVAAVAPDGDLGGWLRARYVGEGATLAVLQQQLGVGKITLVRLLTEHGITVHSRGPRPGVRRDAPAVTEPGAPPSPLTPGA